MKFCTIRRTHAGFSSVFKGNYICDYSFKKSNPFLTGHNFVFLGFSFGNSTYFSGRALGGVKVILKKDSKSGLGSSVESALGHGTTAPTDVPAEVKERANPHAVSEAQCKFSERVAEVKKHKDCEELLNDPRFSSILLHIVPEHRNPPFDISGEANPHAVSEARGEFSGRLPEIRQCADSGQLLNNTPPLGILAHFVGEFKNSTFGILGDANSRASAVSPEVSKEDVLLIISGFNKTFTTLSVEYDLIQDRIKSYNLDGSNSFVSAIQGTLVNSRLLLSRSNHQVSLLHVKLRHGSLSFSELGVIRCELLNTQMTISDNLIFINNNLMDLCAAMPIEAAPLVPSSTPNSMAEDGLNVAVQAVVLAATGNLPVSMGAGELASACVVGVKRFNSVEDIKQIFKSVHSSAKALSVLIALLGVVGMSDRLSGELTGKKISEASYENSKNIGTDGNPINYVDKLDCTVKALRDALAAKESKRELDLDEVRASYLKKKFMKSHFRIKMGLVNLKVMILKLMDPKEGLVMIS
jgi:hypothetical protein